MALVRCPIHKIPYNDENPRGCPACAREKEGGDQANVMRELARMSQAVQRPPEVATPSKVTTPRTHPAAPTVPPVTEPPRAPPAKESRLSALLRLARDRRTVTGGAAAIVLLAVAVVMLSGPRFVEQPHPASVEEDDVRPLPIEPDGPISTVFAILGTQAPQPVRGAPRLARYSFGSDLSVDAINEIVYAITFRVPNRMWRGLRPGAPERTARGALALLGIIQEAGPTSAAEPRTVRGYAVYPSLDDRPRRTLRTEVRPPNGCFDVEVDLQPRAVGILIDGERRYAVVGRGDVSLDWVTTGVRVINRSIRGPFAEGIAC